jgi:hypothetical protein
MDTTSSSSDAGAVSFPPQSSTPKNSCPTIDRSSFAEFRRICNKLKHEVSRAKEHVTNGVVDEFGLPAVLSIEDLLDQLFDCEWGQGEHLQRVVVAIESQTKNIEWTASHVAFLEDFIGFLTARYVVDDYVVAQCVSSIKAHGLDPFRGTVAEPGILKKYKIVECDDNRD